VVGNWLAAVLQGQHERRDELVTQVSEGPVRDDDLALLKAACELAVREYFGADYDVRAVTAFAAEVRRSQGGFGLGLMEMEAVIRAALGEADVDLSGITPAESGKAGTLAVTHVFQLLEWDESAVNEIVTEAETITFRRGWKPKLATL
jgi:hypothetical protein